MLSAPKSSTSTSGDSTNTALGATPTSVGLAVVGALAGHLGRRDRSSSGRVPSVASWPRAATAMILCLMLATHSILRRSINDNVPGAGPTSFGRARTRVVCRCRHGHKLRAALSGPKHGRLAPAVRRTQLFTSRIRHGTATTVVDSEVLQLDESGRLGLFLQVEGHDSVRGGPRQTV